MSGIEKKDPKTERSAARLLANVDLRRKAKEMGDNEACRVFLSYLDDTIVKLLETKEPCLDIDLPYGLSTNSGKREILASSMDYMADIVQDRWEVNHDLTDEDIINVITEEMDDRSYVPDIRSCRLLSMKNHYAMLSQLLVRCFDVEY